MKIELRKVKYVSSMSEETACYSAEVLLDGELAATARNHGQGGNTLLTPMPGKRALLEKLGIYARSLPPVVTEFKDPNDQTKTFSYQRSADELVDKAFYAHLDLLDLRRALKRTVVFSHNGKVRSFKKGHTFPRAKLDEHLARLHPGAVILNDLPESEALAIWISSESK